MPDLSRIVLPRRPLRVRPPGLGLRGMIRFLAAVLAMAGLMAVLSWWLLPGLAADLASRERARPAPAGRLVAGQCSARLFLVNCHFELEARGPAGAMVRDRSSIFFVDLPDRDYGTAVLADPERPGRLLASVALTALWNRLGTYAAVMALVGLIAAIGLWRMVEGWGYGRGMIRAFAAQPARPALLRLARGNRWGWHVAVAEGVLRDRTRFWAVPGSAAPIVLDPGRGLILGVTPDNVHFLPVDLAGAWPGLDAAERAALRASLEAAGVKRA
ncbi:hypothetical protein [Zavarzinia compransoris]|uniref:Uncharacterized protein n=1 Tax=Zavarzinia compransoris TaxID=1264899 RepID=A0A317E6S6_9PROT|nr:hypothetical protein [Zavarzinia compransoris]PWR20765.1 hypothetical protein DKG75_12275 [Zavarzinia compransoris]TDP44402.1 hypothetical protein DES42_107169 [Zavarzinia compransoris]